MNYKGLEYKTEWVGFIYHLSGITIANDTSQLNYPEIAPRIRPQYAYIFYTRAK